MIKKGLILAGISVVSTLYAGSSNAAIVKNPIAEDESIHIRNPVHVQKHKPQAVREEVHIKTVTRTPITGYIKLGAGSMLYEKFKSTQLGYAKKSPKTSIIYNIGLGQRINDFARSDINLQYTQARYKAYDISQTIKAWAAFINGYYDINSYKNVVPYLTAGLGIGYNKASNLKIANQGIATGRDKTNFIWNAGAGALFKVNTNFTLDVGYRYADLGRTRTGSTNASKAVVRKQHVRGHQILGALIYSF